MPHGAAIADRLSGLQPRRQLEDDALLGDHHLLDGDREMLRQPGQHLLDQQFGGAGAGGDADGAEAPVRPRSRSRPRCTMTALGQPARSATSTRRRELEEFGAPTTTISSARGAIAFTAAWRLVVA